MKALDIVTSAVFGHAIGDALGVPVEFMQREELTKCPVIDMHEYGVHKMPKGTWSDDTSMMLATLASLSDKRSLDYNDIMLRFSLWLKEGYMTPYNKPFGIGRTTLKAIGKFWKGEVPINCGVNSERDNGNGSLMRILPISLYNYFEHIPQNKAINNIHFASSLTHAHERSCIACGIYDFILKAIIENKNKESVKSGLKKAKEYYYNFAEYNHYKRVFSESFEKTNISDIKSTGYVVDTLEASIWCVLTTNDYKECVLQAVNLGGDTDTIAAISGGLAGVLYGYNSIPKEWVNIIAKKEEISEMCKNFVKMLINKDNRNKI